MEGGPSALWHHNVRRVGTRWPALAHSEAHAPRTPAGADAPPVEVNNLVAQEVHVAEELVAAGCFGAHPTDYAGVRGHLHPQSWLLTLLALIETELQRKDLIARVQLADPLAGHGLGLPERRRALHGVPGPHLPGTFKVQTDEGPLARRGLLVDRVLECHPARGILLSWWYHKAEGRAALTPWRFKDVDEHHLVASGQHPNLVCISLR
mmetsp:Transcript_58485/g.131770  ORF Transcript_58485/g.131770 Transcript_58485/m.131770 type:complete len:208 (+) Transcript_58485:611-1234(+)